MQIKFSLPPLFPLQTNGSKKKWNEQKSVSFPFYSHEKRQILFH